MWCAVWAAEVRYRVLRGRLIRDWQRTFSIGRGMAVLAVFGLALSVTPASHWRLTLIPLGVGLPAMYLRSRAEFLVIMAIVATLATLLGPASESSHCFG
jgi:hypothetical protein